MAKSSEFLNSICKRNALQNLPKRSTIAITVQSNQIDMLVQMVNRMRYESNESSEKLGFFDNNNLVFANSFLYRRRMEIPHRHTAAALIVMGHNISSSVTNVACMLKN